MTPTQYRNAKFSRGFLIAKSSTWEPCPARYSSMGEPAAWVYATLAVGQKWAAYHSFPYPVTSCHILSDPVDILWNVYVKSAIFKHAFEFRSKWSVLGLLRLTQNHANWGNSSHFSRVLGNVLRGTRFLDLRWSEVIWVYLSDRSWDTNSPISGDLSICFSDSCPFVPPWRRIPPGWRASAMVY